MVINRIGRTIRRFFACFSKSREVVPDPPRPFPSGFFNCRFDYGDGVEYVTLAESQSVLLNPSTFRGRTICVIPYRSICRKVKYGRQPTAEKAAESMHKKTGDTYDAYHCGCCNAWHIGHSDWLEGTSSLSTSG